MVANGQLATSRCERQHMSGRNATAALRDAVRAWPLSPTFQAWPGYFERHEAGIGSYQLQQLTEDMAQSHESVRDLTHTSRGLERYALPCALES